MSKPILTDARAALLRPNLRAINVLTLTAADGTTVHRYADRTVFYDDGGTKREFAPFVLELQPYEDGGAHAPISPDPDSLRESWGVTLANETHDGERLAKTILDAGPWEGGTIEWAQVYLWADVDSPVDLDASDGTVATDWSERNVIRVGVIRQVGPITDVQIDISGTAEIPYSGWLYANDADTPDRERGTRLPVIYGASKSIPAVHYEAASVTFLDAAITSADTSADVIDASGLPSSGDVLVGSEIIGYASKTGNTLNSLTRGKSSTAAAAAARYSQVTEQISEKFVYAMNTPRSLDAVYIETDSGLVELTVTEHYTVNNADTTTISGKTIGQITISASQRQKLQEDFGVGLAAEPLEETRTERPIGVRDYVSAPGATTIFGGTNRPALYDSDITTSTPSSSSARIGRSGGAAPPNGDYVWHEIDWPDSGVTAITSYRLRFHVNDGLGTENLAAPLTGNFRIGAEDEDPSNSPTWLQSIGAGSPVFQVTIGGNDFYSIDVIVTDADARAEATIVFWYDWGADDHSLGVTEYEREVTGIFPASQAPAATFFDIRIRCDVSGPNVPVGPAYKGADGTLIEHPADVFRHWVDVVGDGDVDESSVVASQTNLGTNKLAFDARQFGVTWEDVTARIAFEARANVGRVVRSAATSWAFRTSNASGQWPDSGIYVAQWEPEGFAEQARDFEREVFNRFSFYYAPNGSLGAGERAYAGFLRCSADDNDLTPSVATSALTASETSYGEREAPPIVFRGVHEQATAIDVAQFIVNQFLAVPKIFAVQGIPWWDAQSQTIEVGDVRRVIPPWGSDTPCRVAELVVDRSGQVELRLVEVDLVP